MSRGGPCARPAWSGGPGLLDPGAGWSPSQYRLGAGGVRREGQVEALPHGPVGLQLRPELPFPHEGDAGEGGLDGVAGQDGGGHLQGFSWNRQLPVGDGLHPDARGAADGLHQVRPLHLHPGVRDQRLHGRLGLEQQGQDGLGMLGAVVPAGLGQQVPHPPGAGHPAPGEVDACERVPRRGGPGQEFQALFLGPAPGHRPEALGAVLAAAQGRPFRVRLAQERGVATHLKGQGRRGVFVGGAVAVPEQARRAPRPDPGQLLRKPGRVPRRLERLQGQDGRGGVVAVGAAPGGGEPGHHHVRAHLAQDPDDVPQHRLPVPVPEGVLGVLGEAEVQGPGEILLGPVQAPGVQQFLGAKDPQGGPLLGADAVLAALAPGEG